jgi:hypothetical protein
MEDFIATKPLADLEPEWGDGFMKPDPFVTLLWMDLSRK